jgi:hypothetical protein
MMAGGAIDLDDIAAPEILDPREVSGCIPVCVPGMFKDCPPATSTAIARAADTLARSVTVASVSRWLPASR